MHLVEEALLSLIGALTLWVLDRMLGGLFGSPIDRLAVSIKNWWASRTEEALSKRVQRLRQKLDRTAGWELHPPQAVIISLLMVLLLQITAVVVLLALWISTMTEVSVASNIWKLPILQVHALTLVLNFAAGVAIFVVVYFGYFVIRFQWRTDYKRREVKRTIEKLEAKLAELEYRRM